MSLRAVAGGFGIGCVVTVGLLIAAATFAMDLSMSGSRWDFLWGLTVISALFTAIFGVITLVLALRTFFE